MLKFETYSLIALFYASVGVSQGIGSSAAMLSECRRKPYQLVNLSIGGIGYLYFLFGFTKLNFGTALYAYLPIALLWWGGRSFGRSLVPYGDNSIAFFASSFGIVAVLLYHTAL